MAGRHKMKAEERKSEYVKFRCTAAEKQKIIEHCGEENLSSFLLRAALRKKNNYLHLSRDLIELKEQLEKAGADLSTMARVMDAKKEGQLRSKEIQVLKSIAELVTKAQDELQKYTHQNNGRTPDQ